MTLRPNSSLVPTTNTIGMLEIGNGQRLAQEFRVSNNRDRRSGRDSRTIRSTSSPVPTRHRVLVTMTVEWVTAAAILGSLVNVANPHGPSPRREGRAQAIKNGISFGQGFAKALGE